MHALALRHGGVLGAVLAARRSRARPSTASELSTTASVAVSVLPSPVFISAMQPSCRAIAADQLHVEVAHPHRALARLAHDREALRQQVLERLAVGGALAQHVHALAQLLVAVELELGLEGADQLNALLVLLELLGLANVQRAIQEGHALRVAPDGVSR